MFNRYIATVVIGLTIAATSNATMVINIYQNGSDVAVSGSGTLDLTGLTSDTSGQFIDYMKPRTASLQTLGPRLLWDNVYTGFSGPLSFAADSTYFEGAPTVNNSNFDFALSGESGRLFIDEVYAGEVINFSQTYQNKTLDTMGLARGNYIWSWTADSINMTISDVLVPEPASLLLFGIGAAMVTGLRRKVRT